MTSHGGRRYYALAGPDVAASAGPDGPAPSAHPAAFDVTGEGAATLRSLGTDVAQVRLARRRFAMSCLDWTERRAHLAGAPEPPR